MLFTSRSSSVNSAEPFTSNDRLPKPELHRILVVSSKGAPMPGKARTTTMTRAKAIASERVDGHIITSFMLRSGTLICSVQLDPTEPSKASQKSKVKRQKSKVFFDPPIRRLP